MSGRATVKFFHNERDNTVHFMSGKLGMDIGFDLWIKLESSKTLFENIENMLTGVGQAENVTSVDLYKVAEPESGNLCSEWEVTYNEATEYGMCVYCLDMDTDLVEVNGVYGRGSCCEHEGEEDE